MQQAIDARYKLKRYGRGWILSDNEMQTKICVPNRHSIAFSLDSKEKPLGFLSDKPPENLAKMCDAILFCFYQGKIYLFVIEMKTTHKSHYTKQLTNGKLFCHCLISLFKTYNYLEEEPTAISLLLWRPRSNAVRKGTTTHSRPGDGIVPDENLDMRDLFDHSFQIRNQETVQIINLVKRIVK